MPDYHCWHGCGDWTFERSEVCPFCGRFVCKSCGACKPPLFYNDDEHPNIFGEICVFGLTKDKEELSYLRQVGREHPDYSADDYRDLLYKFQRGAYRRRIQLREQREREEKERLDEIKRKKGWL